MPAPGSASSIVAGTVTGHHLLHIEGHSRTKEELPNGRCVQSRPFTVGGLSWRVWYYPNGAQPECADYISIFVCLDDSTAAAERPEPFRARARFSVLDRDGEPVPCHTHTTEVREFSGDSTGYGFDRFVRRGLLEKSEHLKDDCFTIRCDIIISEQLRTEDRAAASPLTPVPPSDMHRHFGDLLLTQDGADVTFQVAGKTFRGHRCILAARSPVFKAELLGAMREGSATGACVQIGDMLPEVFKILLHFIYNDSLPEMEGQEEAVLAQHLLEAADRYDMQRLKLICEDKLFRHLDVSTAATTLVLAEQHHCHGLKEACIEFLKSPSVLEAVVATDGFEHLSKSCPALLKELMCKLAAR
ncbi:BTB/POZ and MATH domain-containing protein 2 [Setaria viridis]|uniref:BTB domain-containing protein n=1 Tax=Setaria viridis TaxID=4556 RepID=A0A4U6T9M6_SETVI|nr:BTB/POZ and MATH domain-containing protein 2-like [Setaria viridis]TKV93746.1 hypothetical protein SEVIR_9G246100v2 [Setaria viridis]